MCHYRKDAAIDPPMKGCYVMRTFSWQYFVKTGDVDAYLLFKETSERRESPQLFVEHLTHIEAGEEQAPTVGDVHSKGKIP